VAEAKNPAQAPAEARILDTREIETRDPGRHGKRDLVIIYETAPGQRGVVCVPAEAADDRTVARAIKADRERLAKWTGRATRTPRRRS